MFAYSSRLLLLNLTPALLCSFGECRITAFKDAVASLRQCRQQGPGSVIPPFAKTPAIRSHNCRKYACSGMRSNAPPRRSTPAGCHVYRDELVMRSHPSGVLCSPYSLRGLVDPPPHGTPRGCESHAPDFYKHGPPSGGRKQLGFDFAER